MKPIDLETLDPVQRMELADVLYDSAMQAMDDNSALTAEQAAELHVRIDRLYGRQATLVPWETVRSRLARKQ